MKYTSTRGGISGLSFEDALFSGYAPDGGLFFPETIPQITAETLGEWREAKLSYEQVVTKVVRLFVTQDEIPDETLELCVRRAYSSFFQSSVINFHQLEKSKTQTRDSSSSSSLNSTTTSLPSSKTQVSSDPSASAATSSTTASPARESRRVKIAELFHGRTASFKDLALSLVGQFMQYFVNKRKRHVTILIGTSGDTGSASIEAVRGMPGVDIIVLFPGGKVSPVQELQMLTVHDENVHLFQVDGTSDDLDVPIKQCFPQAGVTSINSINWARIMIQISHYVYIYLLEGTMTNVIVPTGAAGNIVSGMIAQRMGVPIKLHASTNANDVVDIFLRQGLLEFGSEPSVPTPANAMDIKTPYNLERVLRLFTDPETVSSIMERVELGDSGVDVGEGIIGQISTVIASSMSVDSALIYETIKNCWEENHYMVCPHTATALALFNEKFVSSDKEGNQRTEEPVYILSTASPFKFPESAQAAGIPAEEWDGDRLLTALQNSPKRVPQEMNKGDDWVQILQNQINSIKYSHM